MPNRSAPPSRFFTSRALAATLVALVLASPLTLPAFAEEGPQEIKGADILAHPAGKAFLAAARLLHAGRAGEVKSSSAKEVREEWAAMSRDERQAETTRLLQRAPEPQAFTAEVARIGVLTIYEESATLRIPSAEADEVSVIAFAVREDGKWKVTGGPMTIAAAPKETAPALEGEAILDHGIGRVALDYARRLEKGDLAGALELLSGPARAKRAAESAKERQQSDEFRRRQLPPAATLEKQIRDGGRVTFTAERAYLNVVVNEQTPNPGGGTTFTSTTFSLPFEQQNGEWRIAD